MKAAMFLCGLSLIVYTVFARDAEPTLILLGAVMLGMPTWLPTEASVKQKIETKSHLTALDKAWIKYHHDYLGRDA